MSRLIINRFFKPSLCKNFIRQTSIGHVRLLSSTTLTSTGSDSDSDLDTTTNWSYSSFPTSHPYLLVDHILKTKDDGMIKEKRLLNEVCDAMTAGFSRDGLEFSLLYNYEHGKKCSIRPVISYNPSNPKLKRMYVHLPDLPIGTQIQNMAMSSLPTRDKDWVVGVKFSGSSRVSFCKPYGSCQWVDAKTTPHSIHPYASIMFSKKDKKFYVPTPGGNHLCSFDPNAKKEEEQLDFIDVDFEDFPKSVFDDLADVSSCSKTEHLVESPSGQLFLVKWYGENEEDYQENNYRMMKIRHSVKRFMVFKVEESMFYGITMIYTEDIGDLCIFLGHSEAFCVPASSSPGLKPNCIYFVGYNFGAYDLTTKNCTIFRNAGVSLSQSDFPYWPPPVPLN